MNTLDSPSAKRAAKNPDEPLKRYILLGGEAYYPQGGLHDFIGSFHTLMEAAEFIESKTKFSYEDVLEWWHIWDTKENRVVSADGHPYGHYRDDPIPEMKDRT